VYGTLKRGLLNHQLIANSRFLGPAATTERFRMIADSFPVLLSYPDGLPVAGELYDVDTDVHYWDGERLVPSLAELYVGNPGRWQDTHWPEWHITNSVGQLEWPMATS
jgi:gamma-glutamylcyclotransferase (GGCT)/AIG2-like uncharacterized protein YtfP